MTSSVLPLGHPTQPAALRVMGIDPGIDRCGVAVVDRLGKMEKLVYSGCIQTKVADGELRRLRQIREELLIILAAHQPDEVAVEELFFATNKTTAMRVSQARGVVLEALAERGFISFAEYTPNEIKETIGGSGHADKKRVALAVAARLKVDQISGPDDASDAVAIALCHLVRRGMVAILEAANGGGSAKFRKASSQKGSPRLSAAIAQAQAKQVGPLR